MEEKKIAIVILLNEFYHLVNQTLDSILKQSEKIFEIIVLTNAKSKKDLIWLKPYQDKISKIDYINEDNRAILMNKALSLTNAEFIHFLNPGDIYLSKYTMRDFLNILKDNQMLDLVSYSFLNNDLDLPEVQSFSFDYFKKGKIPMHMQSMFFNVDSIKKQNYFNEKYNIKADFDMVCRIFLKKDKSVFFSNNVLCDFDIKQRSPKYLLIKKYQTLKIIYNNFGIKKSIYFWMIHDHFKMFKLLMKSLKKYFWGP
jgi:hypothetical protein